MGSRRARWLGVVAAVGAGACGKGDTPPERAAVAPVASAAHGPSSVVLPPAGHRFATAAIDVALDDRGLTFAYTDGRSCRLDFTAINSIAIHTTDEGPRYDDLFWELSGGATVCVVDGAAPHIDGMMRALEALPGFGFGASEAIARASGSTNNATFDIWERGAPAR